MEQNKNLDQKGRVKKAYISVAVVLVVLAGYFILNNGASSPAPTVSPTLTASPFLDQKQSFETIKKGGYSGLNDKKDYVIKSISEWSDLWNKVYSTVEPKPALPEINFNNEMILATFQGSHSTGGYSTAITELLEKENSLEVQVEEISPAPGSTVTQSFTQPFHIIKTKTTNKDIVFKH